MELYSERGYERTTVADIASRAGLTTRTFFRYFADKREVLFAGTSTLQDTLTSAVEAAPSGTSPMDVVRVGLEAAASWIGRDREHARLRQAILDATPELRERELSKLANLSTALTEALRRRGVDEDRARLAAEAGVLVLRLAFERWVGDGGDPDLSRTMRQTFDALRALTSP